MRLSLYTNASRETLLDGVDPNPVLIEGDGDLAMIDEGGYSTQITVDVDDLLDDGVTEIPEGGITVYLAVEVLDKADASSGSERAVMGEPATSNNYAEVTIDNLAAREGSDVSVTSDLSVKDGEASVTVELQNNRLAETQTGNLIVTLLDAEGNVIAERQSYVPGPGDGSDNGLIMLAGEQRVARTFEFSGVSGVADVRVTYSDAVLDADDAGLANVTADGAALAWDEATGTWSGSTETGDLTETLLTVVPSNLDAKVTVNGQDYTQATRVPLSRGRNVFEVEVTSPDGAVTASYQVVIENGASGGGGGGSASGDEVGVPESVPHGAVSVSPSRAQAGQTVTVTATPDEGYVVGSVEVTDGDGEPVEATDNGDGTWSFVMPAGGASVSASFLCDGGALCPSRHLADVAQGAWYHEGVDWAVGAGLMTGYGHVAAFGVSDPLSRAQLAQVLWNRAGGPEADASAAAAFPDCDADAFYAGAVAWCASEGIMTGYEDGTFGPADDMTREQLATVLWRAAGSPEADADLSAFPDAGSVSEFASEAMRWAVGAGAISGQGDGSLDPAGTLERGQCATILFRLYAGE